MGKLEYVVDMAQLVSYYSTASGLEELPFPEWADCEKIVGPVTRIYVKSLSRKAFVFRLEQEMATNNSRCCGYFQL